MLHRQRSPRRCSCVNKRFPFRPLCSTVTTIHIYQFQEKHKEGKRILLIHDNPHDLCVCVSRQEKQWEHLLQKRNFFQQIVGWLHCRASMKDDAAAKLRASYSLESKYKQERRKLTATLIISWVAVLRSRSFRNDGHFRIQRSLLAL